MEVLAAGLCAPGCGAIASAIAGGPMLGAVSMVAAVGYSIYSLASSNEKENFQDAIEGDGEDEPIVAGIVQVAPNGGATGTNSSSKNSSTASFL